MTEAREKIKTIIKDYISIFPKEYSDFKGGMSVKRFHSTNQFTEIKHNDYVLRKLAEIPATLHTMLHKILTEEEWKYFQSLKGQKWLIKAFPAFREADKV